MAKAKRKSLNIIAPPTEQIDAFERVTLAYKRVIAINRLRQTGTINQRQYDALSRYRDIAIAQERSYARDSLDKALHGRSNGTGLPPSCLRNAQELKWLDSHLGAFQPIAHAIAVDDLSISQWAMKQAGAIERTTGKVTYFEPHRTARRNATKDIQKAANILAISMRV